MHTLNPTTTAQVALERIRGHRRAAHDTGEPPGTRRAAVALMEHEIVTAANAGATLLDIINASGLTEAQIRHLTGRTHG